MASLWPDPHSPVLSKIDFGVPVDELLKWLLVRDTFLGLNETEQDITVALALARTCKHPDAVWLTSLFEGKDVSTKERAREVFLCCENDARALCFQWYMTTDRELDVSLLYDSKDLGCAFACASLCSFATTEEERFAWAKQAASAFERDGFFWLGFDFENGRGCEINFAKAKENYLMAAELGHVCGARDVGDLLDDSDPAHWLWLGCAAHRGKVHSFLNSFSVEAKNERIFYKRDAIIFAVGRVLKGNVDIQKKEIFGRKQDSKVIFITAIHAVSFYERQIKSARLAVDTWTLVGIRFEVVKDIRRLIANLIWNARSEAIYKT